jgi:hypothetical protein
MVLVLVQKNHLGHSQFSLNHCFTQGKMVRKNEHKVSQKEKLYLNTPPTTIFLAKQIAT